jgi:hypothetical protein
MALSGPLALLHASTRSRPGKAADGTLTAGSGQFREVAWCRVCWPQQAGHAPSGGRARAVGKTAGQPGQTKAATTTGKPGGAALVRIATQALAGVSRMPGGPGSLQGRGQL